MKLFRIIPPASIITLVVLGFAVYINSLTGSFIWDDNILITDNSAIKGGSDILDIFTKGNISAYTGKTFHIYRPIQMLTYMINYNMGGLIPAGYHFTNVLLHALVALFLYQLINLLSSDKFISFVTSALFVVHPIHTGAVSYISGRADPLSALFAILCFVSYIKCLRKETPGLYFLVFLTYILAIFSRENILVLPALLLAYHYSFKKRVDLKLMSPLILIALSYIVLRVTMLKHLLPDFNVVHKTALVQRLPGFFAAITDYLRLLIWPQGLHMEYGDKIFNFASAPVIFGAVILVILLYEAFRSRTSNSMVTFAFLWFLIALLPVSNLYPIGAYMAEHWLYFPSIGIFLAVAVYMRSLYNTKYLKVAVAIIVAMLIGGYSYATVKQNLYWREPVDFYKMTLKYAPDSIRANNDLAIAYEKIGKHDEAIGIYNRMLKQDPNHPDVYVNLAAIQIIKGNADEAVNLCEKAIALQPNNATAHNNLAVAYYVQSKYDLAIEHCDLAIKYGYKVKSELIKLLNPYRQ